MATRKIAVLDPHTSQPLKGIVVEARAASDGSFISTARTNDQGIASFSLTVAATFHARTANTPPLYQMVIPIDQSWGPFWFNYLVDPAWAAIVASGEGSEGQEVETPHGFKFNVYSTLAGATAAAITSASTSGEKTILVVSSVTEGLTDIGGLGSSATIIITSPDRYSVTIAGGANEDLFKQDSSGGATAGRLIFREIGLAPASGKAVLDANHASLVRNLEFDGCRFTQVGSYLARQESTINLAFITMRVRHCVGSLAGFYDVAGSSAALGPDTIEAHDNRLTMTKWWDGGSANGQPDFVRVQGGFYTISNPQQFSNGAAEQHWSGLLIRYGGSSALFTSDGNSSQMHDLTFQNIIFRTSANGGDFCDFQSHHINPHKRIFVDNIFGFSEATPSGTFITIDTITTDVYVGDIHAPQWPTVYSGPAITPAVPPIVDHGTTTGRDDDDHTQYILHDGTRAFTGAADAGNFVINNVADPVLGHDAVNLNTLLDSIAIAFHYHFLAANVMSSVFAAGEAFEDEVIVGTPQELTTIYQVSTAADTPTPFTIGAGTLVSVHFDAAVLATAGKLDAFVYVQLGYVDADGSSNFVQIGADSDPTTVALTTDKEEVELHIHVAVETNIPAGKRLKVKWWATTDGAGNDPTIHIYYGALADHITIPVSASILGNYLPLAGGTMSGAIAMGTNKVTGLAAPAGAGDALRETATATEANLDTLTDTSDADALHDHGNHGVTHNAVHGIAKHTEFNNWKAFHSDGSGDEQEIALGANATVLAGTSTSGAPAFEEIFTTHIAEFPALAEDLATGVMGGRPGKNVGESGEHGTFTAIRAIAVAGTAGAGTNTILIEADDNPAFSSPTVLYTLALNAATEVTDATLDNSWAVGDIWIRARCTAVGGTAPKDANVFMYFKERAEAF